MPTFTIVTAYDPRWADATGNTISLTVVFAELPDPLPFTAHRSDTEPHGRQLFNDAAAGKYGSIAAYDDSSDLTNAKRVLKNRVDSQAEQIRQSYLSQGSGMAMVYQHKYEEATRLQTDPSPDPANYPVLNATVGIEGGTIQDVATLVLYTYSQWVAVAAAVETTRIGAKSAIDIATTVAGATDAFSAIVWPPSMSG